MHDVRRVQWRRRWLQWDDARSNSHTNGDAEPDHDHEQRFDECYGLHDHRELQRLGSRNAKGRSDENFDAHRDERNGAFSRRDFVRADEHRAHRGRLYEICIVRNIDDDYVP
jgi:hypothetical protein